MDCSNLEYRQKPEFHDNLMFHAVQNMIYGYILIWKVTIIQNFMIL